MCRLLEGSGGGRLRPARQRREAETDRQTAGRPPFIPLSWRICVDFAGASDGL